MKPYDRRTGASGHAFVYANKIDHEVIRSKRRKLGIVTAGNHADLMEALRMLGITRQMLVDNGISLYKVGMTWPLEPWYSRVCSRP